MQDLDGGSITSRNEMIQAYENEGIAARKSENPQAKRSSGGRRLERTGTCHSRYAEIAPLTWVESRIANSPGEGTRRVGDDVLFTPWKSMTHGEGDGKLEMKRIAS
jgi:hypothetical protein